MKTRPFGVTLLAILAGIAAVLAVIHTLQYLHLLPFFVGSIRFFTFDLLGAILWVIMAAIWIWVVHMLWTMNPQGWLFMVALAALNLVLAFVSLLGGSSFQELLPSILVNAIVLIYGLLPRTKEAFGTA
jgi:hypothetical protein